MQIRTDQIFKLKAKKVKEMIIYDFSLPPLDERMYLIFHKTNALMIDPFVNEEIITILQKEKTEQILILLTHEHFDHITGVNYYRQHYQTKVLCSKKCAEGIKDTRKNLSERYEIFYLMNPNMDRRLYSQMCSKPFTTYADEVFEDKLFFKWEEHSVEMYHTPGHSPGSSCIILDKIYIFTGDSLVNGFETITRFPGGSKKEYEAITLPFLKHLPENAVIYPGHGNKAAKSHWSTLC